MPFKAWVVHRGDVTGGEDICVGGLEVLIDDDPVTDVESCLCSEFAIGATPTPTMTMSASILLPSLRITPVTHPSRPVSSTTPVWQRR